SRRSPRFSGRPSRADAAAGRLMPEAARDRAASGVAPYRTRRPPPAAGIPDTLGGPNRRHHVLRTVSCRQEQTATDASGGRGSIGAEVLVTRETAARGAAPAPTAVMAEGEAAGDHAVPDQVTITMPAEGAYLSVLRTATAGLAARLDFTLDEIEDLA